MEKITLPILEKGIHHKVRFHVKIADDSMKECNTNGVERVIFSSIITRKDKKRRKRWRATSKQLVAAVEVYTNQDVLILLDGLLSKE